MKKNSRSSSSGSSTSRISSAAILQIIDKLKRQSIRSSTQKNYYSIWKVFGKFYLRLDQKPTNWEDRITLFVGYLIDTNHQSQTVKCYISAIKSVLRDDNIQVDEDKILLSSLTRACRLKNDTLYSRLPIQKGMLRILLKSIFNLFFNQGQTYLAHLYTALFSTTYYSLFRVGEVTSGSHPIKVVDVHVGQNKQKILFILRTSKTHNKGDKPQKVKISSSKSIHWHLSHSFLCPYACLRDYIKLRPKFITPDEPFFVFRDSRPVSPQNMRNV